MSRISMGSDSTLIAVASIPPRIWEQDKHIWKAWSTTLKATLATRQRYKRIIADFYDSFNKPIRQVTENDIMSYELALQACGQAASTIRRSLAPIRAYWKFAQQNGLASFFAHIAENLNLIETDLEQDLATIHTLDFTPHIGGHGWWMDVNVDQFIWVDRDRQGRLEVVFEGHYSDYEEMYAQPTNA